MFLLIGIGLVAIGSFITSLILFAVNIIDWFKAPGYQKNIDYCEPILILLLIALIFGTVAGGLIL